MTTLAEKERAESSDLLVFDSELLAERDYWAKRLVDLGPPATFPRTAGAGGGSLAVEIELPGAVLEALGKLTGGKPFLVLSVLTGIVQLALAKHGNASPVALATPALLAEGESRQAAKANAVVILGSVDPGGAFRDLLMTARQTLLEAYKRQRFPVKHLLRHLGLAAATGSPLFDVALVYEDLHAPLVPAEHGFTFRFEGTGRALRGRLEVAAGRLDDAVASRLAGRFVRLLEGALADTARPLAHLDARTAEEIAAVERWSSTDAELDLSCPVPMLVAAVAEARPDALALAAGERSLTYGELLERSRRFARRLAALGVGPEVTVAVCAEPGPEMVTALLGVLLAGGAYVPLDSSHPAERLAFLIEDCGAPVVLAEEGLLEIAASRPPHVLVLDPDGRAFAGESAEPLEPALGPDSLAYVIYTSGSTGEPKGVAVRHGGLLNLITWHRRTYELGREDRTTQIAGPGFDASVWEIWPTLTAGASLHFPDPEVRIAPARLPGWLGEEEITLTFLPTPLAEATLGEVWPEGVGLRAVLTGGDRLHAPPPAGTPFELFNHYGPTENTVVATAGRVPAGRFEDGTPPIGRPIANHRIHLADSRLQAVPTGVAGELLIGGASLARGYHGRSAATAAAFVPDPWSPASGERLYRTGDLARLGADGQLDFLGRLDRQVKILGFRIELGEIEAHLRRHGGVAEAVVDVVEDTPEDRLLVAWIVPDGELPEPATLRAHLAERLPGYMVPSAFVGLDALPLSPNGKIDRRALPPPPARRGEADGGAEKPRHPVDETLCAMFAEVLGVERVGMDDHFFELGGNSLLATRLLARVSAAFDTEVPLVVLLQKPTVRDVAAAVKEARWSGRLAGRDAIERRPARTDHPLSPAQKRMWFLHRFEPESPAYNVPGAFRLKGRLDAPAFARALGGVVRRHATLRTAFREVEGEPRAVVRPAGEVELPTIDLAGLPAGHRETEARRIAGREARRPFDLETGPLLKACLLRLDATEHVAFLSLHHIVADGWSVGILAREVAALYGGELASRPAELPEPEVRYTDFAAWQSARLAGAERDVLLGYWRGLLEPRPPRLELPADHPGAASGRGEHRAFPLPDELSVELRRLARREGVTLYMLLLAAFYAFLHRLTGQQDLIVGSAIAGRERPEIEGLIGFFVNMLPLRLRLEDNPRFRTLLGRVRELTLGAYAHQEMPLDELVRELGVSEGLFDVAFGLQNAPRAVFDLPELVIEPLELDHEAVRFGLTVWVHETSGDGLKILWTYDTGRFEPATIARLNERFATVLAAAVKRPEAPVDTLELLAGATAAGPESASKSSSSPSPASPKEKKTMAKSLKKRAGFGKKKLGAAKKVTVSGEDLVTSRQFDGHACPLVIEPRAENVNLATWAAAKRDELEEKLLKHGAILFRGFGVDAPERFTEITRTVTPELLDYTERAAPRVQVKKGVYTSTEFPADQTIPLHHEMSYSHNWPTKIWFYCDQPAKEGGCTPLTEDRLVIESIDPKIRQRFLDKKVMYVRNYGEGVDLSWREAFQTEDRAAVEEYCRQSHMEAEWRDGDRLRTRAVRQVVATHPRSGDTVWFNHAHMFHQSNLPAAVRESLLAEFAEDELPRNAFYGDGTPIETSVLDEIRGVYNELAITFPWQKGDLLLCDNFLVSHGREPFVGPRRVLVAMAELFTNTEL